MGLLRQHRSTGGDSLYEREVRQQRKIARPAQAAMPDARDFLQPGNA
jgi:hypothetical protein